MYLRCRWGIQKSPHSRESYYIEYANYSVSEYRGEVHTPLEDDSSSESARSAAFSEPDHTPPAEGIKFGHSEQVG